MQIAGAVCLIGSLILSWYVANFGSYNATYDSLGAVIGFLIWMWLSTIIVLGGAEIKTARDTTEDGEKPMGACGACMADEVGEARNLNDKRGIAFSPSKRGHHQWFRVCRKWPYENSSRQVN